MKKLNVSAMEYQALLNVDKMVRIAMTNPAAGEFLVMAIMALDNVRRDEGIEVPEAESPHFENEQPVSTVIQVTQDLIRKAKQ